MYLFFSRYLAHARKDRQTDRQTGWLSFLLLWNDPAHALPPTNHSERQPYVYRRTNRLGGKILRGKNHLIQQQQQPRKKIVAIHAATKVHQVKHISYVRRYVHTDNNTGQIQRERERERESCLLYTSPSPRDRQKSRMPSSA